MGVLEKILTQKQRELDALAARELPAPPPRRPVALARRRGEPLRLIAEIKLRSPSAGALSCELSVAERARAYERAGASMISVLTDSEFFAGAWEHLGEARSATSLPILCKEFVIDERQLDAARAYGADAVLLIVRCLAAERVPALIAAAAARDLVPLVEVATHDEARLALDAGAKLVGVNVRDLDSLDMNPERARRVLASLPSWAAAVHLSGLGDPDAVAKVADSRASAALIGEALMRQADPLPLLAAMRDRAG
ncbi:MAG: indole-3-glycerol-phosphate synthase [Myxococcales bacterium]|nr:indole-3-glycerol-phosphate synthase [Myxococcales bacterium]MCB9577492.1 indole-3-glycerol-phosphate synthase [Polyangiaceae bacterium]